MVGAEEHYMDEKKTGLWTHWREDGSKWMRKKQNYQYQHSGLTMKSKMQKDTTWAKTRLDYGTKWNEGGALRRNKMERTETGLWIHWWSNGTKYEEGCYFRGQKIGMWIRWNGDGSQQDQQVFPVCHCPI